MYEAKFASAPCVELWGTGNPEREFIFADDLGLACVFVMERYSAPEPINIGASSQRVSIKELAFLIKKIVGFAGEIRFDSSQPDGMPRKILDSEPLRRLGWSPRTEFSHALFVTYQFFLEAEGRGTEEKYSNAR
jgi:GDP-L-fucose synthase